MTLRNQQQCRSVRSRNHRRPPLTAKTPHNGGVKQTNGAIVRLAPSEVAAERVRVREKVRRSLRRLQLTPSAGPLPRSRSIRYTRMTLAILASYGATCAKVTPPSQLSRPVASSCDVVAEIDSAWHNFRSPRYSYRLPPDYVQQPDQSIDSSVEEWLADDRRSVISDYGFYTGPFNEGLQQLELVECQPAEGTNRAQIVVFNTPEGGVGAGLYWVVPGGRTLQTGPSRVSPLSLYVRAQSPQAEHLPELLAIIRSVQLQ